MCLVVPSFIFHGNQTKYKGTNNDVKLIQVTVPQLKQWWTIALLNDIKRRMSGDQRGQ